MAQTLMAQRSAPQLVAPEGYLDKFWSACDEAKATGQTVSIIHLGDSHIQAGHFTMPIRQSFTQRWGNGGLGWVGPFRLLGTNPPIHTVIRASSAGTSGVKITQRDYDRESPTGMVLQTSANRAVTYTLQCGGGQTFDRIVIYRKRGTQPFTLSGGSSSEIAHDTLTTEQIVTDTLLVGRYVSSAQVTAPASSVWYGASLERSSGGALVHTIGYNGATYYTYSKGSFTSSVATLRPRLIILSLGTNESLARQFDRNNFGAEIARLVRRLQASNPDCAIVLTSPLYCYRKVRVRQRGKRRRYRTTYRANANCQLIADELQQQARELGCGYIDLFAHFGGTAGATQLLSSGILSGDRVHLTAAGYNKVGEAIATALQDDYKQWCQRSPHVTPQASED
ncbi:GDSL-type esterase/lipase family protein [uncultured Porphyromonas sp.]|uniref:GDSL-type esterase/lipase family protein n=1 Tax=uncultured Porphyromonas sp. TaxID=159274 RepID=UPI00262BEBC9|nr:GDSL-type esterase/lipase family protein [uncultured Porphyromonas sp.]